MAKSESPENINAPVIEVRHAALERWSDESPYKSKCPACTAGVLPMTRDRETLELQAHDRCLSCGQLFRYQDIGTPQPKTEFQRDREVCEGASPVEYDWGGIMGDGPSGVIRACGPCVDSPDQAAADAAWIARARERWPVALDEIERLQERLGVEKVLRADAVGGQKIAAQAQEKWLQDDLKAARAEVDQRLKERNSARTRATNAIETVDRLRSERNELLARLQAETEG